MERYSPRHEQPETHRNLIAGPHTARPIAPPRLSPHANSGTLDPLTHFGGVMGVRQILFTIASIVCIAGHMHSQSIFGEIRGTVTDPSGSIIVGAAVTATNVGTGESRRVVTDNSGNYSVLNIDAGTYD